MTSLPRLDDTIAALASAGGPAARGIVRVGGAGALDAALALFTPARAVDWAALRRAEAFDGLVRPSTFRSPAPARLLVWPTRRSYTGQPLVEIHTLGSPPVLDALLEDLFRRGVRPARPGEFTMRAFLSGRIDLTQAEAVRAVIDADGPQTLAAALKQLAGGLSQPLGAVRGDLLDLLADLEAGLDFVEEDIRFLTTDETLARLAAARDALDRSLAAMSGRGRSTGRRRVVLAGLPNAGKSTLFNALAGGDRAIVSPLAGTTRDWLRADVDWAQAAWELIDTAGWDPREEALQDATSDADAAGQRLRAEQLDSADLVVWCVPRNLDPQERRRDDALFAALFSAQTASSRAALRVETKADLNEPPARSDRSGQSTAVYDVPQSPQPLRVSAAMSDGLDALRSAIVAALEADGASGDVVGSTAARCRESLESARASVDRALEATRAQSGDELVAVEVRSALDDLGRVLGAVHTDDLLDRIFSRFCIGK